MPTATITVAPIRMPVVCWSAGRNTSPDASMPARIARPPRRAVGIWCRPRERGSSIAPMRHANAFTTGVAIHTTTKARAKARIASRR